MNNLPEILREMVKNCCYCYATLIWTLMSTDNKLLYWTNFDLQTETAHKMLFL